LKKQGVLALTFANEADYDKISPSDRVTIKGLSTFAPKKPLTATITRADKSTFDITLNHSFNQVCHVIDEVYSLI
jgi:aconitate hydratase